MTDDLNEAQKQHREEMKSIIGQGMTAHSLLMAQVLLARADVDAAIALVSSIIEHLPPEHRPTFEVEKEFRRIRAEKTDELLIQLENHNPEIAAAIQKILDAP